MDKIIFEISATSPANEKITNRLRKELLEKYFKLAQEKKEI